LNKIELKVYIEYKKFIYKVVEEINKKIFFLTITTLLIAIPINTFNALEMNKNNIVEEQRVIVEYNEKITTKSFNEIKQTGEIQMESQNLNIVAMTVTKEEKQKLENNPNVKKVIPDIKIKANLQDYENVQEVGYAIRKLKALETHASKITGKGIKVAVIDSGVGPHKDLIVTGGKSFVEYTESYSDDNGHGTHVAGIISAENNLMGVIGIAPESDIYALKAMDRNGSGFVSDLIEAINWSIENEMDIINLSLGFEDIPENLDTINYLEPYINKAYESGILIVAAAGNDYGSAVNYPAKYNSVIAVSATINSEANNLASFSNIGPEIEVSAPGQNIPSTYLNNAYLEMNGTSMATPFVAGQLALLKGLYPNDTTIQIREKLRKHVLDIGIIGKDNEFGYGLIQTPVPTLASISTESGLYDVQNGTEKIGSLLPQTVSVIEYGTDGWMKIIYYAGEYWVKDGYNINKVYINEISGLYDIKEGNVITGLLGPQFVSIIEAGGDGWYLIETYLGPKWVKSGYTNQRIYIGATSGLYNQQSPTEKVGSITPQYVTLVKTGSDGWLLINTYMGPKWLKVGINIIRVPINQLTGLYKYPNGTTKLGTIGNQTINAIEYTGNGWFKINSYKGIVYIKNGYNINAYYLLKKSGLFTTTRGDVRKAIITPQRVVVIGTTPYGWYKINTYLGPLWVKDGYVGK
jgi:minor extracellular protease Epr